MQTHVFVYLGLQLVGRAALRREGGAEREERRRVRGGEGHPEGQAPAKENQEKSQ